MNRRLLRASIPFLLVVVCCSCASKKPIIDTTNVDIADTVIFTARDTWEIVTSDTIVTIYVARLVGS